MDKKPFLHEDSGLLFAWSDDIKSYEPIAHSARYENGDLVANDIEPGTLLYDFIIFIRQSSTEIDTVTGRQMPGMLDIYQWIMSVRMLEIVQSLRSDEFMGAISRQAGKSHIVRKVIAFVTVFFAKHKSVPEERFYTMFVSVKKELLLDQCGKLETEILKAMTVFNSIYPMTPLQKGATWNKTKKEINMDLYGNLVYYSGFDGVSSGAKVSAGYTSHAIFVDEAQEVNNEHFNEQIKPFVTRTGGVLIAIGTTLPDVENLLYNMYIDDELPTHNKFLMTWEEVVKLKKKNSEDMAEKYQIRVEKEIKKYGKLSEYIQTQYYVSFQVAGDRFITMDKLRANNIFSGEITDDMITVYGNEYVVAGFDPALNNDYAAMSIGVAQLNDDDNIIVKAQKFIIFNPDRKNMAITTLVEKVARVCELYKIDMLMVDASGQQSDRAYLLYATLRKNGINTLLVPYDYGGKNKGYMFRYFEDSIFNQSFILPAEEYMRVDETYAEFVDELLYMKKTLSPSGVIQYKAPNGAMFFDDGVCAMAQLNYVTYYVNRNAGKVVDFGDNIKYKLGLHKYGSNIRKRNRASSYF